jgi:hypothetical protein
MPQSEDYGGLKFRASVFVQGEACHRAIGSLSLSETQIEQGQSSHVFMTGGTGYDAPTSSPASTVIAST